MVVEIALLTNFLSSIFSVLGKKLANSALSEIKKILDVEQNLNKLTSGIYQVQSDMEMVNEEHENLAFFKSIVLDLTELCYDVDDIIDDINLEIMRLDHQQHETDERGFLGRLIPWWNNNSRNGRVKEIVWSSVKKWSLPHKIEDLLKRLEVIKGEVDGAVRRSRAQPRRSPPRRDPLGSSRDTLIPTGRLSEKQDFIYKLLKMQSGGISIVGMAGLGKSVFADSIVNDSKIIREFDVIQWASASNWDSNDDIVINTISSKNGYSKQQPSSGSSTRRSLFLLDNLRVKGLRDWKRFKAVLVMKLKYDPTHIIITSRDPAVAKFTETSLHHLQPLSIEDCEEIIKSKVTPALSHFYNRLMLIAHKCGGLPLAADLIGDHLRSEYRSDRNLFSNVISSFEQDELWESEVFLREIFPELGFDEASLPKKLYKFLAYFALFPSEYDFNKNDLSLLWTAEGFTTVKTELDLTPDIDYLDSLVATSMLKLITRFTAPSTYQMHNFAHKFAQTIARSTYFWLSSIEQGETPSNFTSSYIRHFSSCCERLEERVMNKIANNHSRLRTFLLLPTYEINIQKVPLTFFTKLEYLRVLSFRGSNITKLSHTISNLKHLRYFDVSFTHITRLPEEICNLLGLQVLKLKACFKLQCLPENFENLTNLIHLDLDMRRLPLTPPNLGRLTKLQTLPLFIVKESSGHRVSELKYMNSLSESLKITNLEKVTNKNEAEEAMLCKKQKIERLELQWTVNSDQNRSLAEDILTCLAPNLNLKKLHVSNYNGSTFPSWVNTLKDVGSIHLYNCPNCTVFPNLGLLPLLKELKIEKMSNIKTVQRSNFRRADKHGEYPTLESLKICDMERLEKWNKLAAEDMPCLRELHVIDCPQLLYMPMIRHRPLIRPEIIDCPKLPKIQYS